MTTTQAAEILAAHNAWRRHNSDDESPSLPMQDPLDVGRAIDIAVRVLAECEQLRQALSDLGVTPEEAKAGAARSTANKLDAARYRWLVEMEMLDQPSVDMANAFKKYAGSVLDAYIDAAIDAAMKETK